MMSFRPDEQVFMARAIDLAKQGQYSAKPNPSVGCVIVKDNHIIGEGWHQRAGEAHAEVHALEQAGNTTKSATVYVTLEPCSHQGKTPPCAEALIAANVARVVIAMQDPNPIVSGQGIEKLQAAGINVSVGLMREEAELLNAAFIHKMKTGQPFIMSKVAMSLDGKTALASGESQWITGIQAREDVHRLRAESDVVMTGVGTVLADNPQLTARDGLGGYSVKQPHIVVLDSTLKTPQDAALFNSGADVTLLTCSTEAQTIQVLSEMGCNVEVIGADIKGRVDLREVHQWLCEQSINRVMIEAGALLSGACLQAGLVDELIVYMAPSALGADARSAFSMPTISQLSDRIQLNYTSMDKLGNDIKLTYSVNKEA